MNRAHIITCQSYDDYDFFIAQGFAGLYPIEVNKDGMHSPPTKKLGAKIGTNWDIIADLKRVKPGDYIFLHVIGDAKIYGPFVATTFFLESPLMPHAFKSVNLNIDYWRRKYKKPNYRVSYPWRVGIKSIKGKTKQKGFNSLELFKLKSTGLIHSLPERFIYHDKPKIVKPLLTHETETILSLLAGVRSRPLTVRENSLRGYKAISLHIDEYDGELYREKILEAWLMENVTLNGANNLQYENIKSVFGDIQHFVNSIFTYYTNFMDVLFYNEGTDAEEEYCKECGKYTSKRKTNICVVELKKGRVDIGALSQLREYGDWALKSLANNDCKKVKLYAVGARFDEGVLENKDIYCIRYSFVDRAHFLKFQKIN